MYKNPILYADYSDPDVIRVGEDFYMVASSFTYFPAVPLLHSKDLVHWEIINYCIQSLPFEKYNNPSHGSGTWAPSIRYHDGTFFVFIPLVDEGIYVARSKNPYEPFELNCLIKSKGFIDPCPLWDDDGKTYMVFAYARSRCGIKHRLSIVEIDKDCTKVLTEPKVIFDGEQIAPTTEGPKFYKKNGYYYIFAPSGGVATGWQSVLRSKNIYGDYEYKIVMHQGNTDINGPHQGGLVDTPDGKEWFIHFQDVKELGRITHLQPVFFNGGWPFIGIEQNGDGIGEPVSSWNMPVIDAPHYKIATSDNFQGEKLGLQWQFQANPKKHFYNLCNGKLNLYCLANLKRENLLWYAPNALTQIFQSKQITAVVKVQLNADKIGDFASLGIIAHEYGYICIEKADNGYILKTIDGFVLEKEFEGLATEKAIDICKLEKNEIWLKLSLKEDKTYCFSYSLDGFNFIKIEKTYNLKRSTWTGAKLCIWSANRENLTSRGYGIYDYITIENV